MTISKWIVMMIIFIESSKAQKSLVSKLILFINLNIIKYKVQKKINFFL